jgi:O-antigen/teichoic acid export membrane protein
LADRFILDAFHDSATVGIYAASYGLASQPFIMLSAALTLLLRPHMFEAADQDEELVRFFRREWLKWVAIVGGAGIALLALLREQIAILFLAPAYRGETWLLVIIGGAYLFLAWGQLGENYLLTREKTRRLLRVSVWSTVASVIAAVALIPKYAAYGAAWSTFVGLGTYAGLMWLAQTGEAN